MDFQLIFQSAKVLVIGDLMLDEYLSGNVTRISPEAPVPVVDIKSRTYLAGGAANVAVNIRSMGGTVTLAGLIGADAAGERLRGLLNGWGIASAGLVDGGSRETICKTRIVAGQQQIVRIDQENRSPISETLEANLISRILDLLPEHNICVLSDYAKGVLSERVCRATLESALALGKRVIVDPKGRVFEKYRGCFIIAPNLQEAATAVGRSLEDDESLFDAGQQLLRMLPGSRVLITRGAEGMTLFSESAPPITVPTVARRVFDVVGAGDTVVATLALALGTGLSPEIAVRLATLAAGIVVGKPGTATVSVDEITEDESAPGLLHAALMEYRELGWPTRAVCG